VQGLKLKAGESLVSMAVLPPELAQQVKAAQEAAKAAEAAKEAAAAAAGGVAAAAAEAAAADSSAARSQGPWLLMVTRNGTGKRVPLQDVSLKANRGTQGVIGIKLAAGGPFLCCLLGGTVRCGGAGLWGS
jgi:DNA gyrase/topoisomerase IV subunit A